MTLMRTDTWLNTVTINGVLTPAPDGIWDTFKGGDVDSTTQTYRAGGMADQEVYGGQVTVNTITLDKALDMQNDWAIVQNLMVAAAGSAPATVHRQPLDINKNPYGTPLVYSGILKSIMPGDTDSNKADTQIWTITIVPAGNVGIS